MRFTCTIVALGLAISLLISTHNNRTTTNALIDIVLRTACAEGDQKACAMQAERRK